jgi:hypothetical protein
MNVTRGWSTDFAKLKFSIMVEEADLLSMLAERGAEDPVAIRAKMRTQHVYLIMDAEAMAFVHHSLSKVDKEPTQEHLGKVQQYRAERDALLDKYVPTPEPAE